MLEVEYDDQDGLPIREFSSGFSCPTCIGDIVYFGHGDYDEVYECYCQSVFQDVQPGWENES